MWLIISGLQSGLNQCQSFTESATIATTMIKCCSRSLSIPILYLAKMHHANIIPAQLQKQV